MVATPWLMEGVPAPPEPKVAEKQRYLREPRVVFVTPLIDGGYAVADLNGENVYIVSEEVLKREYTVLY